MQTILDEILEVSEHEMGCGCRKCQRGNREQEFMGSIFDTVNKGIQSLANFSCWIEDLKSLAKPKSGAINHTKTPRNINDIDKVVLHQMAFSRGSDLNKYLSVTAHYIVMPDGKIGQLYPDTTYMNASSGFNSRSVAIEFAGNFPNTKGVCWEKQKFGCHTLSTAQMLSGRCLLANLRAKLPMLKYVLAHRQSSNTRENDPGPDIWYQVGEWAINNLGYSPDSRNIIIKGAGKTIPAEWINWGNSNP